MSIAKRIAEQHRRAYHGEAWHGPSVFEILEGVSPAKAILRPIARAHSIWEIVLHLTSWERIVHARFVGTPIDVAGSMDWPKPPAKPTKKAWDDARRALQEACAETTGTIAGLSESKLMTIRPGTSGTYEELALGQLQHALYHAGQLAVLKKGASHPTR